ncbi:MAG: ABC transporter ATP-binding protein [Chloroflexi bacterium]|nr:ABC transporter ATP-binding protein [Chloroflexota bacterium]
MSSGSGIPAAVAGHGDLQIRNLRKTYSNVIAVDDVSLTVHQGEFLTLLGPSGSGKTTTLMMIAGFVPPSGGTIVLGGRSLTVLPPHKRDIGMVFQHYALFPHLTVAQNIAFPLEMRSLRKSEVERRVQAALDLVRLPDFGARYPRELSGGQQQRIALARAIVFEPSLLLMDEPLGALDKKLREHMQLEIKTIHHDLGVTVIYVTHDQEEALVMSDRIAVFNHGKIEQLGSPSDLYDRPATPFVADFLGESNFIPATVTAVEMHGLRLRYDRADLVANVAPAVAVGDNVTVTVRPEKTLILPVEAPGSERIGRENWICGTIADVVYLGESRKYLVHLSGGVTLIARQQATSIDMPMLQPEQEVVVGWHANDCVVLPGQSEAGAEVTSAGAEAREMTTRGVA